MSKDEHPMSVAFAADETDGPVVPVEAEKNSDDKYKSQPDEKVRDYVVRIHRRRSRNGTLTPRWQ
jgi:hypothetical protein